MRSERRVEREGWNAGSCSWLTLPAEDGREERSRRIKQRRHIRRQQERCRCRFGLILAIISIERTVRRRVPRRGLVRNWHGLYDGKMVRRKVARVSSGLL